ncbi:trafficking regulator of GLUT4 1 [Oryzias melastigma]|uniref:Trafficking regulator of GLUT4 (SLC2A4) 1b n=1 Tax=Oryzias melastigma TaxID=30732 RepID=A0A3B3BQ17_ORYME|nr:trafficking regulator of GLUT4 1 [Oryzias melastigma]
MAINTDAVFEKSALGDREVSNPTNFQDTEKLLGTGTTEPSGQSNLKPSDSFSLNIRGSVRSLDPDQTEPSSPLRSGSIGHLATPPKSSSRISLGQLSAVPPGPQPSSYLWLAVLSCFCPAVPLNACALWYSNVSKSVLQTGDVEGARKYGRLSMLLSILAIVLGVAVIIFIAYTIEAAT